MTTETEHRSRGLGARAFRVTALSASFLVAGILFLGTPAAEPSTDLPDPQAMAAVGDGRRSSEDVVQFWLDRLDAQGPSVATLTQLSNAQRTLARDTGDLAGFETAEATAEMAVDRDATDEGALLALASARAGQHDFDEALALAERVLDADPTSAAALLVAGDTRLELGDVQGARSDYVRAAIEVGGAAPIISRQARLESVAGSIREAETLARRALVEAADSDLRHADAAFYWFQLASYQFHTGQTDEAVASLEAALSIDPEHGASTELYAKTLAALDRDEEAIAVYEAMVDGGGAADLHGELAKLYQRAGRSEDATEQIELGLAVARRDADRFPAERRHLISFLSDHDPQEALRLAELDLAERSDVHSHAWYAWSLLQTGRADEAHDAITPALALGTEDALLLYQAGSIKAAVGESDEAADLLARALELNPVFDLVHADRARALLDDLGS